MLKIDGTAELKATAALFGRLDKPTRDAIRGEAKSWAPTLTRAAMRRAREPVDVAVAASGKVTQTSKGLTATFGTGTWHGEKLANLARPWEFGTARPDEYGKYVSRQRTSRKGMQVKRRVQKQVPPAVRAGRFIYPAVADCTPDLVGRWVRAIAEAAVHG